MFRSRYENIDPEKHANELVSKFNNVVNTFMQGDKFKNDLRLRHQRNGAFRSVEGQALDSY